MAVNTELQPLDICAIIVTYYPSLATLDKVLTNIASQVGSLIVVDNGSDSATKAWLRKRLTDSSLVDLRDNCGLSAGFNKGIDLAVERGSSHVLLMDQDSIAGPQMVGRLIAGLTRLRARNLAIAAVGPKCVDPRYRAEFPFVRLGLLRNHHISCRENEDALVPADFLISSGTLIPLDVIASVGAMDEGLFVDNLDLEWSFRVRALGYGLYGICNATMQHHIGDSITSFWFGGRHDLIVHSPTRLYYMMRNRLLLYKRSYTPWRWIYKDVLRALSKLLLFSLLVKPRKTNLSMMLRGLADGYRGVEGRLR